MSSTYGENLKLSIFGQSHGPAIGMTLDGIPAGLPVDLDKLQEFLNRRAPGQNDWSTPRKEEEDNINMLISVQEYCRMNNKKMIVKYHPANNPKDYAQYLDAGIVTTYGKEISIEQFGNIIDIAVVSASTVFTAMLKQWIPVFLYVREGHDPKLFGNVESLKFSSANEFKKLINWTKEKEFESDLIKLREFFLAPGNYETNYKKAFSDIGVL